METFKNCLNRYNEAIVDNTFMEVYNGSTFSPKIAVYYNITFSSRTFAAFLIILAAFECSSGGNYEIRQGKHNMS